MSKSYRDLLVWQKSFDLVAEVYRLCDSLPKKEQFEICSQIRRAAVSIPSNIAEGQQRNSRKEFKQYIGVARGSAAELSTQLLLIYEVYGMGVQETVTKLEVVQRMLYRLQIKL